MRRGSGLVLGYESGDDTVFGFARPEHTPIKGEAITYDGDGPVCVIAPTGAGKGRDFLIPNILTWPGPLIVTDLKGELASVCARRRRELGFKVAVLDPFEITRFKTARLNPFDIFALNGAMLECDAEMLASQLSEGHIYEKDAFWNDQASSLIGGLVVAIATLEEPKHRNLTKLKERLFSDDVVYNLAVLLDTHGKKLPPFSYGAIAAFLQAASENTRPSILSTAHTYMRALNSEAVGKCLINSSIKLADVIAGKPLDVFLCIPPEKLKSHKCLIRLWLGTLLTAIMRRKVVPAQRTLLVADEAAQLGEFEPLLTACTLLRGIRPPAHHGVAGRGPDQEPLQARLADHHQ